MKLGILFYLLGTISGYYGKSSKDDLKQKFLNPYLKDLSLRTSIKAYI